MSVYHPYKVLRIYDNGDDYLKDILTAVSEAAHSIYVESYIFELPDPGTLLLETLETKFKEGLDIKIMVDGFGSLRYTEALQRWSEANKIPVHIYNPLPWRWIWRIIFFPLFLIKLIWHSRSLNRRNHRKMIVIDGKKAFLGSINFSKVHFVAFNPKPWFDVAVQIEGASVLLLEKTFSKEFNRTRPSPREFWGEISMAFRNREKWLPARQKLRLNRNFVLRFLFWRDFLRRIRRAKKRVYIMNAYFVPHRTLTRSLAVAARNGADVVVLLPSETDVPVVKWFAPIFYRKLIEKGVHIREMQNQIIHAKSAIIDDWGIIGSNNLNYRSLLHDLEVEAVIDEPSDLNQLFQIWEKQLPLSRSVLKEEVFKLSLFALIRYRLVLLIRYFI